MQLVNIVFFLLQTAESEKENLKQKKHGYVLTSNLFLNLKQVKGLIAISTVNLHFKKALIQFFKEVNCEINLLSILIFTSTVQSRSFC